MGRNGEGEKEYGRGEPEDMLAIVHRMRGVPRFRPGLSFRVRVFLLSFFPTLGAALIERRGRRSGRAAGPRPAAARPLRVAAVSMIACAVILTAFALISIPARNSNPGDPLYFVKRIRENLELALTGEGSRKAEKNLDLAETRLVELKEVVEGRRADSGGVSALAEDYSRRVEAVSAALKKGTDPCEVEYLASRLKGLKAEEENIAGLIAARFGPEGALERAAGALVTVTDSGGASNLGAGGEQAKGRAGEDGEFSFDLDIGRRRDARSLEVRVEHEGRATLTPLLPPEADSDGQDAVRVEPRLPLMTLDTPQRFTLTLPGPAGGKEIRLRDTTGTSRIDGGAGAVILKTDEGGRCDFTVTKTSDERVSRISAEVLDGTWRDLGEVLVLGCTRAPEGVSAAGDVVARSSGPPAGPRSIEIDNGLLRLKADRSVDGRVITGISAAGKPGSVGPVYDPAARGGNVPGAVKSGGPRLFLSGRDAAGYEVAFDIPCGGGEVRRTYRVTLARGDEYAFVSCRTEVSGLTVEEIRENRAVFEALRVAVPGGAGLEVGGREVDTAATGTPVEVAFDVGKPYAAFKACSGKAVVALSICSETYPEGWTVAGEYVGIRVPASSFELDNSGSFSALIGITGAGGVGRLVEKARSSLDEGAPESGSVPGSGEGFLVKVTPDYGRLRPGRQRVTVQVFKRYRRIIGD